MCCIVFNNEANIKKTFQSIQDDFKERENVHGLTRKKALKSDKRKLVADKTMAFDRPIRNSAKNVKWFFIGKSPSLPLGIYVQFISLTLM